MIPCTVPTSSGTGATGKDQSPVTGPVDTGKVDNKLPPVSKSNWYRVQLEETMVKFLPSLAALNICSVPKNELGVNELFIVVNGYHLRSFALKI